MVFGIDWHAIQPATDNHTTTFLSSLDAVMTRLAQRLPIVPVPEQAHVTLMRDLVIHNCCFHDAALLHVEYAKRMLLQENSPGLLPAMPITTLSACLLVAPTHEKISLP